MKKLVLLATALTMVSGSAFAADLHVKALKAPPPAAFDPWDIAFGSAIMNDYVFRGVTQSNHKPSVAAYFEPRYNVTKDLQLYVGSSFESISFANRAAAEVDIYGGIRPTFGAFAFDFGVWGYLYPGGSCADNVLTGGIPGGGVCAVSTNTVFLANGNVMKKDVSFYEGYAKVNYTINDMFQVGANEFYSPNFLNSGAWGNYASITGKFTAPSTTFARTASRMLITTLGTSVSALPTRCSHWTCATPTPTCRRAIAMPSRAPSTLPERPASRRSIRAGLAPTGAARPVSSSSRLT